MRDIPYLVAGLSDADMTWLLAAGRLMIVKPGHRLIEAGRAVTEIFFLIEGKLDVSLRDGTVVATLGPGDVVGEMSFVEKRAPSTSVKSGDKSALLAVPRDTILERFAKEPKFEARFYRALAAFLSHRLRFSTNRGSEPDDETSEARETGLARFARLLTLVRG